VDVEMRYGLAAICPIVNNQSEPGIVDALLLGNMLGNVKEVSQQRLIGDCGFAYAWDFLLGNNQDVDRCLWRDIVKSHAKVVLMDDPGGNLLGDDLRK
jgi:hypothetical protein